MKSLAEVPLLGSPRDQAHWLRHDRIRGLREFNEANGEVGRLAARFGSVLLVNTPELVHDVLVTHARSFEKSAILRTALYPLVGEGLFTSEGDLWRRQRKLMAPLFQPAAIKGFAADMVASANRTVDLWRDGDVIDMAREMTRVTMAVAGKTLFGIDTFDESDELGAALTTALEWAADASASKTSITQARLAVGLEVLTTRLPRAVAGPLRRLSTHLKKVPILLPGKRTRALERAVAVLDERVARMIAERRTSPGSRHDVMSLLLGASAEDGDGKGDNAVMTDQQVRDEVLTLFVAGHETTANAMTWALMLLAQHPDIYRALRAEVDAAGPVLDYAQLPRLGLALRVFKEAMRLYPPVYLFGRVAIEATTLGPYAIPHGTVVLVSPWALHRRPAEWPDPAHFDPSRFLPEREAARPKTSFIPLSAGPRTCIGNHFAFMEGPLLLAAILRRADVALVDPRGATTDAQATLRPLSGLPMRIRLRDEALQHVG